MTPLLQLSRSLPLVFFFFFAPISRQSVCHKSLFCSVFVFGLKLIISQSPHQTIAPQAMTNRHNFSQRSISNQRSQMAKEVSGHTEPYRNHQQALMPGAIDQIMTSRRIDPNQHSRLCSTQPWPRQNRQNSASFRVSLCHVSSVSGASFYSCVSVSSSLKPVS